MSFWAKCEKKPGLLVCACESPYPGTAPKGGRIPGIMPGIIPGPAAGGVGAIVAGESDLARLKAGSSSSSPAAVSKANKSILKWNNLGGDFGSQTS